MTFESFVSFFPALKLHSMLEFILKKHKSMLNLHNQYHTYWWLGDSKSQNISQPDIDLE